MCRFLKTSVLESLHLMLWPSGLRRWLKAPFRKGVGSNPTGVSLRLYSRLLAHCAIVCHSSTHFLGPVSDAGANPCHCRPLAKTGRDLSPRAVCPAMRRQTYLVMASSDCASTWCRHDLVR